MIEQELKLVTCEEELSPPAIMVRGRERNLILGEKGCGACGSVVSAGLADNTEHSNSGSDEAMATAHGLCPLLSLCGIRLALCPGNLPACSAWACLMSDLLHPS